MHFPQQSRPVDAGGCSRREFFHGAAGLAVWAAWPRRIRADASAGRPRNVLFISVDDLNPSLGCYGNRIVQTPHIDRLAAQGVRFTRAYAQWPSCLPSRVSFLSGWYPPTTGHYDFSKFSRDGAMRTATYLGQHFKNHGWFTARLDKVFHIGHDDPASWTLSEEPGGGKPAWTGMELSTLGLEDNILRQGRCENAGGEKGEFVIMDCADEQLFDGQTARRAADLLEQCAGDGRPFFLACGFRRPHQPRIAPKKYFDLYPPETIELPPRQSDGKAARITDAEHREIIAHYYASVTFIDAQIGKVLGVLERTGLKDRTTVVLFGDQGYCLGERDGFFGKGNLWDRSLRVPLIVAVPGSEQAGTACDRPVGLIDLYPTLMALCGLPPPDGGLHGGDFSPLLNDPQAPWRDDALSFNIEPPEEAGRLSRSIRTARYRYTESAAGSPLELVDYDRDPYERHNLTGDPACAGILSELQTRLRAACEKAD